MAEFEKKEGSGVLFKKDKQGNEKRPDYSGNIFINGKEMWLSAWVKEGKNGKFFSLMAQPKDAEKKPAPKENSGSIMDMDSDLPF